MSIIEPSRDYIRNHPKWRTYPVHQWRYRTNAELIYDETSKLKLEELWKNWQKMPKQLKDLSDQKCIELYDVPNKKHLDILMTTSRFDGYEFVLHKHNPRHGSEHYDLRFMDLKNSKLLHSFAAPSQFLEKINKCTLYKTRDHDPRWISLKSYRLDVVDFGLVTYKLYDPNKYFVLEFHGNIIKGLYQLFKLKNRQRDDVWLFIKK